MKKAIIPLLIIGGILVVAGGVVLGVGIANYKADPTTVSVSHPVEEPFQNLSFKLTTADLEFKPSEDGKARVDCVEKEKLYHEVKVENNTLTVTAVDDYLWYENIFGLTESLSVTVYLPSASYGDLSIKSSTGDIIIPEGFSFENVNSSLSTGNTKIRAQVKESLIHDSSTGDVLMEGVSPKMASIATDTGRMSLSKLNVAGELHVETSTGKMECSEIRCKTLRREKGGTGDIRLKDVIAEEKLSLQTSTGDVAFEDSDSPDIYIKTSTGDITGTLLTGKRFTVHVSTGKPDVPSDDPTGGICVIDTSTGDVRIRIKE